MTYSFPEDYNFQPASPDDVPGIAGQLVSIWVADKPDEHGPYRTHREQIMLRHALSPEFHCFTASRDDVIVGFSYGMYHGEGTGRFGSGQASEGTHDHLIRKGYTEPEWRESFDIGDLQVLEEYRKHHVGEGLFRLVCEGLPPGRVVLSVDERERPAIRLYTKLQFEEVFRIQPQIDNAPMTIVMSRMLPLSY